MAVSADKWTGGLPLKYRVGKKARLDIVRLVYSREMTVSVAAIKFDMSPNTVKGYLRLSRTKTERTNPQIRVADASGFVTHHKGRH